MMSTKRSRSANTRRGAWSSSSKAGRGLTLDGRGVHAQGEKLGTQEQICPSRWVLGVHKKRNQQFAEVKGKWDRWDSNFLTPDGVGTRAGHQENGPGCQEMFTSAEQLRRIRQPTLAEQAGGQMLAASSRPGTNSVLRRRPIPLLATPRANHASQPLGCQAAPVRFWDRGRKRVVGESILRSDPLHLMTWATSTSSVSLGAGLRRGCWSCTRGTARLPSGTTTACRNRSKRLTLINARR